MPKFIFAYHGGATPSTPQEGEKVMAKWMAWMASIGPSIADGGNPVGPSMTVSKGGTKSGGESNPLSGYTLVNADTMEAACAMAAGCPINDDASGSVEVCECMEM